MSKAAQIILSTACLMLSFTASACVCFPSWTLEEAYETSAYVVVAEVGTTVRRNSDSSDGLYITAPLYVSEVLKGRISDASILEMRLYQPAKEDTCSMHSFAWHGDVLLLFLDSLVVTEHVIGACSPSGKIHPSSANADLARLRALQNAD